MPAKMIELDKDKLVVELEDLSLAVVLADYVSKTGGVELATFVKEHPYLTNPKIVIKAKNPKQALLKGIEKFRSDLKALREKLE